MNTEEFAASLVPEQMLPELLDTLEQLVAFDTVRRPAEPGAPFGANSARALDWLLKTAADDGFTAVNLDHYCGYIELGNGKEMVAVACHLDVVPPGNPADWATPPFRLTRLPGRVAGRGCGDDKGPLAAVYQLMRELRKSNVKLRRRLRLIVGCAEETGSECLDYYRDHAETPRYGITPDAIYPVVCGECGRVAITLEKRFLPGENRLFLSAGDVVNAVPAHAEAEYGGRKFSARGKAAHAAHPEQGVNALLRLCSELEPVVDSDFLRLVSRLNRPGLNLELEDEVSRLTLVPSLARVDAESARVTCDIRFPVTMRSAAIIDRVERAVAETGYRLTVDSAEEPLYFAPDSPFIRRLLRAYSETAGDPEAKPLVIGGGTYAKHLPNTVAFGCALPGRSSNIHEPNESWNEEEILLNLRILSQALCVLDTLD